MNSSFQHSILLRNIIGYASGAIGFGYEDSVIESKIVHMKKKIEDEIPFSLEENELCLEMIETVFLDLEPWAKHDVYDIYLGGTRSEFLEVWQKIKHDSLV